MSQHRMTPALTEESQESKLVSLAFRQAQTQLEEGIASSQIVVHFLRLGSKRADLEMRKIELEGLLIEEKIAAEKSGQQIQELYLEVVKALKSYTYSPPGEPDDNIF